MSRRWFAVLAFALFVPSFACAQGSSDPLRFIPSQAEWVAKIDRPLELLRAIESNETFAQARKLAGVRELYDTTNFQHLYQLIAYFEKNLDSNRDELIAELSSGGIAVGTRVTPPEGAVLVIQSKDEKKLRRFVDLALEIAANELERLESKDRIVKKKVDGVDVFLIGPKLCFAIADSALIIASHEKVLGMALDASKGRNGQKGVLQVASFADALKLAPPKALAWTWFHLEEIRKFQKFKDGLDASALDPFQNMLFGGLTNQIQRAAYVAASIVSEGDNYRLGVTMPCGRNGMAPISHMILPPDGKGTLPPLNPPRTLASSSYFLDLGQFWDKRVEILGEKNAKGLDEGNQGLAKLLGGIKLSKLFHAMGPHHRLVFAQQKEQPYKIKPAQPFPAVALVVDMRDPSFAKDMNSIFRAGALLATFSVGLNLKEETYKDCEMVSYHFSETKKVEGDPTNIRFNFTPTYVKVGNSFVMSGTAELARDLIDELLAEREPKASKASMQTRVFGSGFADQVRANEEATLTQLILAQALPPKNAKEELQAILRWLDSLGSLHFEMNYGDNDFRYDILWKKK